jgi:hypothetical protein
MPKKFGPRENYGWLPLIVIVIGVCYYRQLKYGLVVTDMRDFTSWEFIFRILFFCSNKL